MRPGNVPALACLLLLGEAQAIASFMRERDLGRIASGDAIFLEAEVVQAIPNTNASWHNGGHLQTRPDPESRVWVSNGHMRGKAPFYVMKVDNRTGRHLETGDAVYLVDSQGMVIDTEDGLVRARSKEVTEHSKLTITKGNTTNTGSPIHANEMVRLRQLRGGSYLQSAEGLVSLTDTASKDSKFALRRLPYGGLHEVVGPDGVLMITLQREGEPRRSGYSLRKLEEARVFPVEFAATDAKNAPYWELHMTCPLESEMGTAQWCNEMGRYGQPGCRSQIEQAITDSHRRALVAAMERDSSYEWTAIIEDDVVPFEPEQFHSAFRKAWKGVPEGVKMVRLGWCTFESDLGKVQARALQTGQDPNAAFKLIREQWWTDNQGSQHYYTGGCTTGYMVHKSFIPEVLKIFPCCCPIDCCLERQLFYGHAKGETPGASDEFSKWRGPEIMIQMDGWTSRSYSQGFATFNQSGVLLQDNRELHSERPAWNQVS